MGTSLSEDTNDHVNALVQSGRRAVYGLQSAGLCTNGVTPDAAAHMIKVAIQPVLVYGCGTINITPGAMKTLEKTQGRLNWLIAHLDYQNTVETRLYSKL